MRCVRIFNNITQKFRPINMTFFQVFVFCLVRELPDVSPLDRLQKTLQKYGMLAPDDTLPSEEQKQLEQLVAKRVRPLKGK